MVRGRHHHARRALPAAVLVTTASALLTVLAGPSGASVTQVVGSAYGYSASNIVLFGSPPNSTAPTPRVALSPTAKKSPLDASAPSGTVAAGPATFFTSDAITVHTEGAVGPSGNVASSVDVNNVNRATTQPGTTGSEIFSADLVHAECAATGAPAGFAAFTNAEFQLNSEGPVVQAIDPNPAPNTRYDGQLLANGSTEHYHAIFNEQIANADGSLTVNAVHEFYDGPDVTGELIIGQVVCGLPGSQPPAPADVSLDITGPASVQVNSPARYFVTVHNAGPNDAMVAIPVSLTGGTISQITGDCVKGKGKNGGFTCSALVSPGSSTSVVVDATSPRKPGTMTLTASVMYGNDTSAGNDSGTVATTVTK